MKRTTIYLPDELKAALERTAAAEGRSEAEVVRSALVAVTAGHAYPPPRLPAATAAAVRERRSDYRRAGG